MDNLVKLGVWVIEHSPTTVLPALFLSSLFIILAPSGLLVAIGISNLSPAKSMVPGLVCVISGSFIGVYTAGRLVLLIREKIALKHRMDYLKTLTKAERDILKTYHKAASKSAYLDASDGVVAGLQKSGIIFKASEIAVSRYQPTIFAYNIEKWAWNEIMRNPSLFES